MQVYHMKKGMTNREKGGPETNGLEYSKDSLYFKHSYIIMSLFRKQLRPLSGRLHCKSSIRTGE